MGNLWALQRIKFHPSGERTSKRGQLPLCFSPVGGELATHVVFLQGKENLKYFKFHPNEKRIESGNASRVLV